jgi:hypothetical protein
MLRDSKYIAEAIKPTVHTSNLLKATDKGGEPLSFSFPLDFMTVAKSYGAAPETLSLQSLGATDYKWSTNMMRSALSKDIPTDFYTRIQPYGATL